MRRKRSRSEASMAMMMRTKNLEEVADERAVRTDSGGRLQPFTHSLTVPSFDILSITSMIPYAPKQHVLYTVTYLSFMFNTSE